MRYRSTETSLRSVRVMSTVPSHWGPWFLRRRYHWERFAERATSRKAASNLKWMTQQIPALRTFLQVTGVLCDATQAVLITRLECTLVCAPVDIFFLANYVSLPLVRSSLTTEKQYYARQEQLSTR